jgi:Domain of unknown function (DUF4148)
MKRILFAAAVVACSTSLSAFAQTSAPVQPVDTTAQAASNDTLVPSYRQPTMQKTRLQVYQELVQAERDGQLAYLNSTIYAHP